MQCQALNPANIFLRLSLKGVFELGKISKVIWKNMNIAAQYGIAGALRVYFKIIKWQIFHALNGGKDNYIGLNVNDYKMYVNLKDKGISRDLFVYGTREADQVYIVRHTLKRGMSVLDIGANIGYYVILESLIIGKEARIAAYEPSGENCSLLKKNLELNNISGMVEVNNEAVSNRAGKSRFYLSEKSNLHTLNPVSYRGEKKAEKKEGFVEVKTADICEILGKNKDVGFIRMDIEGHEVEVLDRLAMAVNDLKIYPGVLFETHFPKYDSAQHDIAKSLRLLFGLGYAPKYIVSSDERLAKFRQKGYVPSVTVYTDRVKRGIYEGIPNEEAIELISATGGIRAVFLEGKAQ